MHSIEYTQSLQEKQQKHSCLVICLSALNIPKIGSGYRRKAALSSGCARREDSTDLPSPWRPLCQLYRAQYCNLRLDLQFALFYFTNAPECNDHTLTGRPPQAPTLLYEPAPVPAGCSPEALPLPLPAPWLGGPTQALLSGHKPPGSPQSWTLSVACENVSSQPPLAWISPFGVVESLHGMRTTYEMSKLMRCPTYEMDSLDPRWRAGEKRIPLPSVSSPLPFISLSLSMVSFLPKRFL